MSDTPETDAARHDLTEYGPPTPCSYGDWVAADFACKLERERDEAREKLADWENSAAHVEADYPDEKHCACVPVLRKLLADARKERDEAMEQEKIHYDNFEAAKEQIKELIYIAERGIALAEIDFENDKFGVVSELRAELDQLKEGAK